MSVSVFYLQCLLKWIPADLHYQVKSLCMNGEREGSFLGFVQIFILGKLTITEVLFEGSKWEDFSVGEWNVDNNERMFNRPGFRILQRAFSDNMQLSILGKLLKIKYSSTLLKK